MFIRTEDNQIINFAEYTRIEILLGSYQLEAIHSTSNGRQNKTVVKLDSPDKAEQAVNEFYSALGQGEKVWDAKAFKARLGEPILHIP